MKVLLILKAVMKTRASSSRTGDIGQSRKPFFALGFLVCSLQQKTDIFFCIICTHKIFKMWDWFLFYLHLLYHLLVFPLPHNGQGPKCVSAVFWSEIDFFHSLICISFTKLGKYSLYFSKNVLTSTYDNRQIGKIICGKFEQLSNGGMWSTGNIWGFWELSFLATIFF